MRTWIPFLSQFSQRYEKALFWIVGPHIVHAITAAPGATLFYGAFLGSVPFGLAGRLASAYGLGGIGDTHGRCTVARIASFGMAFFTAFMSFLPTLPFETIGKVVCFYICRFFLTLFATTLSSAGSLLLIEPASPSKKAQLSALFDVAGSVGLLTAACLTMGLGIEWSTLLYRLAALFHILVFCSLIGVQEKPQQKKKHETALHHATPQLITAGIITAFIYCNYYFIFLGDAKAAIRGENAYWYVCYVVILTLFGKLLRHWSPTRILKTATYSAAVAILPLRYLNTVTLWGDSVEHLFFLILGAAATMGYYPWVQSIFPKKQRFRSIVIAKAIGGPLIGESLFLALAHYGVTLESQWLDALAIVLTATGASMVFLFFPQKTQPQEV